jgi:hypothetical protein
MRGNITVHSGVSHAGAIIAPGQLDLYDYKRKNAMQIDADGTIVFSAEENQELMDQLKISPNDYDDPPVELEYIGDEDGTITIKATNTKTGKHVLLGFDLEDGN